MTRTESELSGRDAAWAAGLALLLAVVYALLIQFNYTWDGAFFVHEEFRPVRRQIETHLLFGPWLRGTLIAGAWLHLDPRVAGSLQSVFAMACAMGLYYLVLRRCGSRRPWAIVFTLLMGFSAPAVENATTVEVYALALLAVILSLHAFLAEASAPSRRGAFWFIVSNIFVGLIHTGYCFWVLGAYLALGISERRPARLILRLGQGFIVALALAAAKYMAAAAGISTANSVEFMFSVFYLTQSAWMHAFNFVMAPAESIQAFAGLAIFPAVFGWRIERRRLGAVAIHAALSLILFIAFFHAWNIDLGNFYLPVIMILGIFAALGCESAFRQGSLTLLLSLGALALLTVVFVMLPFQEFRFTGWLAGSQYRMWIGIIFYAILCVQWILAGRMDSGVVSSGVPALAGISIALILLTIFCYLPRPLFYLKPDETHDYTLAVRELMRGRDIPHQRLITCFPIYSVRLETGVTTCPVNSVGTSVTDGTQYDRNPASEWVRDSAKAVDPLHVWIDQKALGEARRVWSRGIMADIPIELLEFRPVVVSGPDAVKTFYEIAFKNPAEGRRYARRLDPYPAENWGGTPVVHTRPNYEQTLRRESEWLEFKYWIGHEEIGAARPVRVEISINGKPAYAQVHTGNKLGEPRLHTPASLGPEVTLQIRVTPSRRSEEGRELGVGLYPFKWINP